MKNINDYILELEYKKIDEEWEKYFDIDDSDYVIVESKYKFGDNSIHSSSKGFFGWLKRLGKKFWNWLIGKDFTDDDTDWGIKRGIRWIDASSDNMANIVKKKGFKENFPETKKFKDHYPDAVAMLGQNRNKVPAIITSLIIDKEQINEILKNNYRREYSSHKDTIDKMDSICMILSIEVSNNNDDDIYFIFDNCITSLFDDNICKKFDMIFFHPLFIKTKMFKELNNGFETPVNLKFPVILTKDVGFTQTQTSNKKKKNKKKEKQDNNVPDGNNEKKTTKDTTNNVDIDIKKKDPKPTENDVPENKIVFTNSETDQIIATADYTNDVKTIEEIIQININDKDYYNFLITSLDIDSKYSPDDYEHVISDFIMPSIFNKLADAAKIKDGKDIKVYIKLDGEKFNEHIKKLRKLSLAKSVRIKESINNMFIIIGKKTDDLEEKDDELKNRSIKESLDIDNLFWMLDVWFANNEQERSTFMSLIDNCVIKKTYNKSEIAKLCDNINFDIRPFINFMSKDAVVTDNDQEDFNIDYYYELKKIIDALISNKATNNKYVRFS